MKKKIIVILLAGIMLLISFIGIKLYLSFNEPNAGEVLKTLLTEPENQKLNTSEEKTEDISFQITGGGVILCRRIPRAFPI